MSKQHDKYIIAVFSFVLPFIGVILYFIYKPKEDGNLFGVLGLLGWIGWMIFLLR